MFTYAVLVHQADEVRFREQWRFCSLSVFKFAYARPKLFSLIEVRKKLALPLVVDIYIKIMSRQHNESWQLRWRISSQIFSLLSALACCREVFATV